VRAGLWTEDWSLFVMNLWVCEEIRGYERILRTHKL
jgi:hypothetical protein